MTMGERAARIAPAAERNKDPILEMLKRVLPAPGLVLEIASGTGQHAVHFAQGLPNVQWQPSDPDEASRESIAAWREKAGLPNLLPVIELDVRRTPWPVASAAAIVCINMIHISPIASTHGLLDGAARLLSAGGVLLLYGPYKRGGVHTAPSNESFDMQLRSQNPEWGVRDLERVIELAAERGLAFDEVVEMPANNLCVVFRRTPLSSAPALRTSQAVRRRCL